MKWFFGFTALFIAGFALANPYAGQQERSIKALSGDEAKALLAGAGHGYAKAAELNRYPGPMHALELAGQLGLSPDVATRMRVLMDAHKTEARSIGAEIVTLERELDTLYAERRATKDTVETLSANLGLAYGRYRAAHLTTHIEAAHMLTPEQIAHYDVLRGYSGGTSGAASRHRGHAH